MTLNRIADAIRWSVYRTAEIFFVLAVLGIAGILLLTVDFR